MMTHENARDRIAEMRASIARRVAAAPEAAAAAIAFCLRRRREAGIENNPADLEQLIVASWKSSPAIQREFRDLGAFAATFRAGVRGDESALRVLARKPSGEEEEGAPVEGDEPYESPTERLLREAEEEDAAAGVDPRLPAETRARAVWRTSPQVRQEFSDNREAFIAFRVNLEKQRAEEERRADKRARRRS